ncbi:MULTISPECIES: class I SAM-dependent methyltransferase [unclassified Streptomyces]|uniref:class I SAM-dependent methyltransferase n=1 Tax=unclassified Streptomyces TaxID=2593676 RepID=UPI0038635ED7
MESSGVAALGARVVELGPALAAVARRDLRAFPRADVEVADFEQWALPPEPFDLVGCATAFHWVAPALGTAKVADVARPGLRPQPQVEIARGTSELEEWGRVEVLMTCFCRPATVRPSRRSARAGSPRGRCAGRTPRSCAPAPRGE